MILREVLESVKDRMAREEKQKNAIKKVMQMKQRVYEKDMENRIVSTNEKNMKRIKGENPYEISPTTKSSARAFRKK